MLLNNCFNIHNYVASYVSTYLPICTFNKHVRSYVQVIHNKKVGGNYLYLLWNCNTTYMLLEKPCIYIAINDT